MPKPQRNSFPKRASSGQPAVVLRGASFTAPVAQLASVDPAEIGRTLAEKITRGADLFRDAPVVLDLEQVQTADIELPAVVDVFRRHRLTLIAVRNASEAQAAAAHRAGLGVLYGGRVFEPGAAAPATPSPPPSAPRGRLVTQAVRSGQRVVAPDGDLVVVGPVNVGAEVLAAGNVHVYGPLRGRALAGFRGDTHARIFTLALDAELLAVAGIYRAIEDGWPPAVDGRPAQVYLDGENLVIAPLPGGDEAPTTRT